MANDVSELQQAKIWLRTILLANADIAAGTSGNIYADHIPSPLPNRCIVINFMGGSDVRGVGKNRLVSMPLFQIRLVGEGTPTAADKKTDRRIDDVLAATSYAPSGDFYFTAYREEPIDRPEVDTITNKVHFNIGGLFRVRIGRTV